MPKTNQKLGSTRINSLYKSSSAVSQTRVPFVFAHFVCQFCRTDAVRLLPAEKMAESTVRLEGVINHVLRRRILRSERQIIPKSLRKDDCPPSLPGAGFAVPAVHRPPASLQGYGGWQMPASPGMQMMPVIAGWIFHPGVAGQQMPGWPDRQADLVSTAAVGAIGQPSAAHEGAQELGDAAVRAPASDCSGPAAAGGAPPVFILRSLLDAPGSGCDGRAPSLATRCPSTATRCSSTVAGGLSEAAERTSSAATRKRKAAAVAPPAADADLLARKSPKSLTSSTAKSSKSPETTNAMSTVEEALLVLQAHEDELKRKQSTIQAVVEEKENDGAADDGAADGLVGIFSEQAEHNWWGTDFARTSSIHRTSSSAGISTSELLRNASPFIRNFCRSSSTASRVDGCTTPGFARTSSGFAQTISSGLARTASSALMRTCASQAAAAAPFGRTQSGAPAGSGSITPANALALLGSLEQRASGVSGTATPKDDLFALPIERTSSTFARTSSGLGLARTSSSGANTFGRTLSSSFGRTQSGVSAGCGSSTPANAPTPVITPRDDFGRTASSTGFARAPTSCAQLSAAAGTPVLSRLSEIARTSSTA